MHPDPWAKPVRDWDLDDIERAIDWNLQQQKQKRRWRTRSLLNELLISVVLSGAVGVSIAEICLPPLLGVPVILLCSCLIGATLGLLLYPIEPPP